MTIPAFVSIHDLMPDTLEKVSTILDLAASIPASHIYLLVVPNLDWTPKQIDQLRRWQNAGHQIVGHGWVHRCSEISTAYHRIHSLLISRDVAEHLSLSCEQVINLIGDCYQWLEQHGFVDVCWYVPPAWAMGSISRQQLQALPFRFYETQTGVYDSEQDRFHRIPLVGYEADTLTRSVFLRAFNFANGLAAKMTRLPVRVSIHPFDLDYRLGQSLARILAAGPENRHWQIVDSTSWLSSRR